MKRIPLTKGKFALVDDADFEHLSKYKWTSQSAGYARRTHYLGPDPNKPGEYIQFAVLMHRYILGAKPRQNVDHINRDKLDNRRENLRLCTPSENAHWRGRQVTNTSGYKGAFHLSSGGKRTKPWLAQIVVNRKPKYLGYYSTAKEAAKAYDVAAKELHGDFAWLNFPEEAE